MKKSAYTNIVYWPLRKGRDRAKEEIDDRIADWLDDLNDRSDTRVWIYGNGSCTKVAFHDPEDALAFKLMIAGI